MRDVAIIGVGMTRFGRFPDRGIKDLGAEAFASVIRSGSDALEGDAGVVGRAAQAAYEMAGMGPDDIDVAEVHDATAYCELDAYEQLGFCAVGEGGGFVETGHASLGGRLPVNPSGGLLARGHPVGATGVAQLVELTCQLRGQAENRQVSGAQVGLAQNAGGYLGSEEAAAAVHIIAS